MFSVSSSSCVDIQHAADEHVDVNKANVLRQRRIDHVTYTWADGPLNDLNIKVLDADRIGLKSCLYLGPIEGVSTEQTQGHGNRLFVATTKTTFKQYSWYPGMTEWVFEKDWTDLDGHASPACYGFGKGHTFYTWFVNLEKNINMYWYVKYHSKSVSSNLTKSIASGSTPPTKPARRPIQLASGLNVSPQASLHFTDSGTNKNPPN